MKTQDQNSQSGRWYQQPAMKVVAGVLISTLMSGVVMLTLALGNNDPLVISDADYQQLRDDFRLTEPRELDGDSPSGASRPDVDD